jgi:hypothetical protein
LPLLGLTTMHLPRGLSPAATRNLPPKPVATTYPAAGLYVHDLVTATDRPFSFVAEVVNTTAAPVQLQPMLFTRHFAMSPGRRAEMPAGKPPPATGDRIVAVLRIDFPTPPPGGSGPSVALPSTLRFAVGNGAVPLDPGKSALAKMTLPAGCLAVGENVMELTLERDDQVVATSGPVWVQVDRVGPPPLSPTVPPRVINWDPSQRPGGAGRGE